jgi:hypothetical protein
MNNADTSCVLIAEYTDTRKCARKDWTCNATRQTQTLPRSEIFSLAVQIGVWGSLLVYAQVRMCVSACVHSILHASPCVCVCVRARARTFVRACERACVHACMQVRS